MGSEYPMIAVLFLTGLFCAGARAMNSREMYIRACGAGLFFSAAYVIVHLITG